MSAPPAAPTQRFFLDPLVDGPLTGPRVLQLVPDASGPSLWRAWQPTRFLQFRGYPVDWVCPSDPQFTQVPVLAYDLIVLCRLSWQPAHRGRGRRFLAALRRAGKRVLYECDDDLFTRFSFDQQARRTDREASLSDLALAGETDRWALTQVDGVTCSTQYLASTVRRFTDVPVEVVPNAIDADWFTSVQQGVPRPVAGPTVGWAGGGRPGDDLEPMAVAWGRIARARPDVTFLVAGNQPPILTEHVPEERLYRLPWLPPEQYPAGMVGMDVGCCPLADRAFNRCKTPIKAWEFGLSGSAVVASPTVYGACIEDGRNGWLAETADEWEAAIRRLLEDDDQRRRVAGRLEQDVRTKWSLAQHYWRWPLAWSRLMGGPGGD